ncbi:MAG: hypothetical protein ACI837_000127 [Crocinitomicaceae bacterium]
MFICSLSFFGSAQVPEIEWGELQRKQGTLLYFLPSKENEFYALRWAGGRVFGHYKASKHVDIATVESARIRLVADESVANFEGARVFQEKFIVFLSDKKEGRNYFYMQQFNDGLESPGESISIASYELDRSYGKGIFDIRISTNGDYFGVVWEIPAKKDEKHKYGFKVFNADFEIVNEGEYLLPFTSDLSEIHEHHISNNGDYFICLSEYKEEEKKKLFKTHGDYKALHIYHINDDNGLSDFTLDLDGKRVVAMAMYSGENDIFTMTGIYGAQEESGVSGVFYQRVNLKTEEVLDQGFREFEDEFITQGWSERAKRKVSRREDRGKGGPELYSYKMRDVNFLEDGSVVGTMEQFYVQVRSTTDGRSGQSSNIYYYYYNDIIAYKIDSSGSFDWVKKIKKYQVSINDGGPYSSFESFVDNGEVHFIFNDNLKNYRESGEFIDQERIHTANYGRRNNAVSLASINLESGEMKRDMFFDRSENNTLVVPKLFSVNYKTRELWVYSVSGRKEKIGLLHLKH